MGKKNQYLKQIVPHLKEKYDAEKADAITASAWRHYEAICAENPDEPKAYDMHTKARIYPAIVALQAMMEAGVDRWEPIDFLCEYYLWRARGKAKMFKGLLKVPGLYRRMPGWWKKLTPKMFGEAAGFEAVWHDDPEWELCIYMVKCPYKEKAWSEVNRVLRPGGSLVACFCIKGESRISDWLMHRVLSRKGWFTPPFETYLSLKERLQKDYILKEYHKEGSMVYLMAKKELR